MCGITGLWTHSNINRVELDRRVQKMNDSIRHRGPDDNGVWIDEQVGIGLGHRRLSILDLSLSGHQPMSCHTKRYWIIFNGEIYNHLSLRQELEQLKLAPSWRGHSDTETLLACFLAFGVRQTLERIVGMFAIVLWDRKEQELVLMRDRFGEKPLYYGWANNDFVFGSELKALRTYPGFNNSVNRDSLALYMEFSAVPEPHSIYKDIFKLKPGCFLIINKASLSSKQLNFQSYWKLVDVVHRQLNHQIKDEQQALFLLEKTLLEVVASQTVADVPIGAFLSGGIDSSLILALMRAQNNQPIKSFTIGFENKFFDESSYARAVAKHLGTEHHELHVNSMDIHNVIALMPKIYDEPFADSSQIPTYLVCQAARQHVKVILSGDGGDELFGGYSRYLWCRKIWKNLNWMPSGMKKGISQAAEQLPVEFLNLLIKYFFRKENKYHLGSKLHQFLKNIKSINSIDDVYKNFITEWPQTSKLVVGAMKVPIIFDESPVLLASYEPEHQMMIWDSLGYLPYDILTKVERASMSTGLETRIPFLDHRLADLAWRLPLNMKIRNKHTKWALRQILYKHIPRELIERPKAGFGAPVGDWLRGPLRLWAEALIHPSRLILEGYLNPEPIQKIWLEHLTGRYDWTQKLWTILMFQIWLEEYS